MLMLSSVLVNEGTPLHIRNAAGLALKNALTARVSLTSLFQHPFFKLILSFYLSDHRRLHDKQSLQTVGQLWITIRKPRSSKMLSLL